MNVAVYFAQNLKICAQIMANFSALGTQPHPHAVRLCLPVLSLLCAWARHLKTRTQRSQAICTSVPPLLKLLLTKKIYHLNSYHPAPLPSENEQRLENEQRKSYRILMPSSWTIDIRLFDFYRKRGLGPVSSEISDLLLFFSYFASQNKITKSGNSFFYVLCKLKHFG